MSAEADKKDEQKPAAEEQKAAQEGAPANEGEAVAEGEGAEEAAEEEQEATMALDEFYPEDHVEKVIPDSSLPKRSM